MKILSLLNGNIHTLRLRDAAAKKNYSTYDQLSKYHDITVLASVPVKERGKAFQINENMRIIPVCLYYPTLLFYLEKIKIFPASLVYSFHRVFSFLVQKHFVQDYDLCIVDGFLSSGWLGLLPESLPVVYASHNVEYDWYKPKLDTFCFSNHFKNYIFNIEKKLIERSALVTVVSDHDRKRFIELYGCDKSKIETFPIGFTREDFKPALGQDARNRLKKRYNIPLDKNIVLFCGSNFYANQEAVDFIIRQIAPGLEDDNEIVIVGNISKYIVSRYQSLPKNIHVLGFVDNITEIYQATDVALNPILTGSGTNVKAIECLGAGLDLISTEFGIRGYESLRNNILVCEVKDMAQAINNYFSTGKRMMSTSALKKYEWEAIAQRLSERLLSLV